MLVEAPQTPVAWVSVWPWAGGFVLSAAAGIQISGDVLESLTAQLWDSKHPLGDGSEISRKPADLSKWMRLSSRETPPVPGSTLLARSLRWAGPTALPMLGVLDREV